MTCLHHSSVFMAVPHPMSLPIALDSGMHPLPESPYKNVLDLPLSDQSACNIIIRMGAIWSTAVIISKAVVLNRENSHTD